MFNNSLYAKTMDYIQMSMGTATKRQEVLANNIANVDTPFYKVKKVTFEAELNRVADLERKIKYNPTPFKKNNSRHIALETVRPYQTVNSNIIEEYDTNYKNDKNNVDIEKESALLVKNNLHYNALAAAASSHLQRFKSVLA